MWKALFHYLPLDDRVRKLGIAMASWCNCCIGRKEETLDHVLSMGAELLAWSGRRYHYYGSFQCGGQAMEVEHK